MADGEEAVPSHCDPVVYSYWKRVWVSILYYAILYNTIYSYWMRVWVSAAGLSSI